MGQSRGARRQREALAKMRRKAKKNVTTCQATGKRRYQTSHQAEDVVVSTRGSAGTRVYQCDDCGGWHLTSKRKHH